MNIESIREELADILDLSIGDVTDDLNLNGLRNWDSLAMVSLVAFLVSNGGQTLEIKSLGMVNVVRDLWDVLRDAGMSLGVES